jgi:hypothetical protein
LEVLPGHRELLYVTVEAFVGTDMIRGKAESDDRFLFALCEIVGRGLVCDLCRIHGQTSVLKFSESILFNVLLEKPV